MRKFTSLHMVTTLLLIFTLVITSTVISSATTVKINKTSALVYSDSSVTLRITGTSKKTYWSTTDKSVATVAPTGKYSARVKGNKAGTATITAKVGAKKYKCKVTVKYADGSRQNPAIATNGVSFTTYSGQKGYFKVENVYKGAAGVSQLKAAGIWDDFNDYEYENKEPNTELLVLQYQVKAISGFDKDPLSGYSIINSHSLYNGSCSASINDLDYLLLSKNSCSDLSLFNGAEGIMYFAAFVPKDITAFSNYIDSKGFKKFWIKYTF